MRYFEKLPVVSYNGQEARNILARARFSPQTRANKGTFYPYTMSETDRPDILSHKYYDNADYAWLVWMSNDVVDPYYDLNIPDPDMLAVIEKKYGSLEVAKRKIKHYVTNWVGDTQILTISQFNALAPALKQYYAPVLNNQMAVDHYARKKKDLYLATNRIVTLEVSNATGSFTLGEEVAVNSSNYGFVISSNTTHVNVNHVTGQFQAGNMVTGKESGKTASVVSSVVVVNNIPDPETPYWKAVSFFEYEMDQNQLKRNIKLIDNRYKINVENELKRAMSK